MKYGKIYRCPDCGKPSHYIRHLLTTTLEITPHVEHFMKVRDEFESYLSLDIHIYDGCLILRTCFRLEHAIAMLLDSFDIDGEIKDPYVFGAMVLREKGINEFIRCCIQKIYLYLDMLVRSELRDKYSTYAYINDGFDAVECRLECIEDMIKIGRSIVALITPNELPKLPEKIDNKMFY